MAKRPLTTARDAILSGPDGTTSAVFSESPKRRRIGPFEPMVNSASPYRCKSFAGAIWMVGALIGLVCSLFTVARAQPPQAPANEPQLHHLPDAAVSKVGSSSQLVTIYASVRDKHGKIVANLTRDDFMLEEDGRPQTISDFVAHADAPLTIGLLVDTSESQRALIVPERNASYTFLDHLLTAKDAAFVIHFDREIELLQDVTSARHQLQSALQLLDTPQLNHGDGSSGGDARRSNLSNGRHLYDAIWLAANELMKKRQGRKALFVISSGVDRGSHESLTDALEAAQRADTAVYTIYYAGEQNDERQRRQNGRWGGPTGWPGGGGGWPGGGGGNPYPTEPRVDGKKILLQISAQTGGMMFEVSKKLPLDQIYSAAEEGLRNQYRIGYAPNPPDSDPSYHTIHLTAKQKGLQVQARQGYYSGR